MSLRTKAAHAAPRSFRLRTRLPLSALAAAAAVSTLVLVPLSQTVGAPVASAQGPSCNGNPDGLSGNWTCTFDDEFNGTSLNTANWQPQLTATSGYITGGPDCYVDNPQHDQRLGRHLNLSVLKVTPFPCAAGYVSQYQVGMVTSSRLFSQTYGAFEVRAKIPAANSPRAAGDAVALPAEPHLRAVAGVGRDRLRRVLQRQTPRYDVPYIHYAHSASGPECHGLRLHHRPDAASTPTRWTGRRRSITILDNGQVCLIDQPIGGPGPVQRAVLHLADPGPRPRGQRPDGDHAPCRRRPRSTGCGSGTAAELS